MNFPEELRYTKEHEWAKKEGNVLTVGITEYAQDSLGDIVYAELPDVGKELKPEETFGVVESIKAVSDLYSPVGGKVTEINQNVVDSPETLNQDPYGEGWMLKIELSDEAEWENLMDSKAYQEFVESLQ